MKHLVQLTVTGLTGKTGVIALSRVVAVNRPGLELAPTLQQPLEDSHALGRAKKRDHAMTYLVQLMETGQTGVPGVTAQSPVGVELRSRVAVVMILLQRLVDLFALEIARNPGNVTMRRVEDQLL